MDLKINLDKMNKDQSESNPVKERRFKMIWVDEQTLVDMLTTGNRFADVTVLEGAPPGSTAMGVHYDPYSHGFHISLVHPDFEPVLRGQTIPILDIVLEDSAPEETDPS